MLAGQRTHVHQPVRLPHHIHLVLHDEHRVPGLLEPAEHAEQRLRVGRVQPGRRLVQDVDDAEEARPQLGGQPQPLELA